MQVLADNHGNVVHLWERDCSMQRRHQKLIEESPAPALPIETRTAMCEAAVRLVKRPTTPTPARWSSSSIGRAISTSSRCNARIQVEHPVTEMVTGIDLIKAQILVAAGEPLPFKQEDIEQKA